jgi:hypothetical protein
MTSQEFTPPLSVKDSNKNISPENHVSSVSLLMHDAHGKLFALHVATEANYIAGVQEFSDGSSEPETTLEPVFLVPELSISDELILDIITGISPPLLARYLVPQET